MEPPKVCELVTRAIKVSCIKDFNWRIKDYWLSLDSGISNKDNPFSIEFDVGESIGLPSTWKLTLAPKKDLLCKNTNLILGVTRTAGSPEAKYFYCRAFLIEMGDKQSNLDISAILTKLWNDQTFGEYDQLVDASGVEDDLVINVEFGLYSPKGATAAEALLGGGHLAENYGKLLESGDNSDFVITVKESDGDGPCTEIKVHKNILGAQFPFFQKMLDSGMKEVEDGTWTIEDLSPACVQILLKYIYTRKLDDGWKTVGDEMVKAADKYGITQLLNYLDQNLHAACTTDNAMKLRGVAKFHKLELATNNIKKFIMSNFDRIFVD